MGLEPAELARWTRFAAKGGIGKCTATCDCVAESADDLMFLKDDEIIVLLQLQNKDGCYLGYCEGVIGRFSASDVTFHSKLKKPVMTKRASTNTTSSNPYSPTPPTPTTPTSIESRSFRKMQDEMVMVSTGGRSSSQNSLGRASATSTATASPIPSNVSSQTVGPGKDARKFVTLQYGVSRDYHHGISLTDDVASLGTNSLPESTGIDETSLLDSPQPTEVRSLLPTSTPVEAPSTLLLSGREGQASVDDHDATSAIAPLRIIKRYQSNPNFPLHTAFSGTSIDPSNDLTRDNFFDSLLTDHQGFDNLDVNNGPTSMPESNTPLLLSSIDDIESDPVMKPSPPQEFTPFSSFDTVAGDTCDDLATNHPGRFSRFSIQGSLDIPRLLAMSSQNADQSTSSSNNGSQTSSATTSPRSIFPTKFDGRTSLSIAARGKVDEATLASTQAQVGIGLSLLQDLVGGMSSDSDYSDSDEEPHMKEVGIPREKSSRLSGFGKNVNSIREESSVHGFTYADEEDEMQSSSPRNGIFNEIHRSTSMKKVDSSNSLSKSSSLQHSPELSYRYPRIQRSHDSFTLPDVLGQRRPSLARSVVSGISGKSGRSGSWDGDFYENYRHSVSSNMTGARRPSTDSVRQRVDVVGVGAGRSRLGSIGPIPVVSEEPDSVESTLNTSTSSANAETSFFSQDTSTGSISKREAMLNQPLSHKAPLPSSTGTHPTYSHHVQNSKVENKPPTETSPIVETNSNEATVMADSTSGKLVERQSSIPNDTDWLIETEEIDPNEVSISSAADGPGQDIVIDDDEELPSKILQEGNESDNETDDDTFLDSMDGHILGRIADSPEPLEGLDGYEVADQARQGIGSPSPNTSFGRLATLFVSNRTPSPLLQKIEDTETSFASAYSGGSSPSSPLSPLLKEAPVERSPPPSSEPIASPRRPPTTTANDNNNNNNSVSHERRSLFLPHPNAPKAPANVPLNLEPGPGVGARNHSNGQSLDASSSPPFHISPPVQVIIRMALSAPPRTLPSGPGKPPIQILPTIYGRTGADLANSIGPVPIMFSVDPPPPVQGVKATPPQGVISPQIAPGNPMLNGARLLNHQSIPLRRPGTAPSLKGSGGPLLALVPNMPRIANTSQPIDAKEEKVIDKISTEQPQPNVDTSSNVRTTVPPIANGTTPIPRPSFTPKTPGSRPRSRSFSGFNSSPSESRSPPLPVSGKNKSDLLAKRITALGLKRSPKPSRPSPLSVSTTNPDQDSPPPLTPPITLSSAPTSPLARSTFGSTFVSLPQALASSTTTTTVNSRIENKDSESLKIQLSRSTLAEGSPPAKFEGPPSLEPVTQSIQPVGSRVAREPSLRSKLSLPNLRRSRTRDDDSVGIYDHDTNERQRDRLKEVVQVKDTEFELVMPTLPLLQVRSRMSEDSVIGRPETSLESRIGTGLVRSESPTTSLSSPVIEMREPNSGVILAGMTGIDQSMESIEAHRQRETKWVSLMSSSPASLSRKSKKVKKLLIDGVPSSVRYLIWSYLTDGKGRAVKGVYEQLCQRGEVARSRNIRADAERLFGKDTGSDGMQYLHATKDAVVVLLQAYFSMVPDVQYMAGLTKIVGQLLLLAPEEDAFWIFTSIMDTHIRTYFTITIPSARSTQMEVDAALYSRTLESIDPFVARKLFVELGFLPGALCYPWFSSLFVGSLPPDYINRVWDIFLYEGIPFLIRVALSITTVCRKFILSRSSSSNDILAALARPPRQWLPPTPETFLALVFNVKLKDDDIRKQRVKMSNLVKRQTQAQQPSTNFSLSGISLPSLHRA